MIIWAANHIRDLEELCSDAVLPGYPSESVCPSKS